MKGMVVMKNGVRRPERRKYLRLPIVIGARLKKSDSPDLKGKTKNISFGGAFVELEAVPIVKKGDYYSLRIFSRIEFTGQVIHTNEQGIGLKFDFILIEYYELFKKMMLQNATDPDRVIKELGRSSSQPSQEGFKSLAQRRE